MTENPDLSKRMHEIAHQAALATSSDLDTGRLAAHVEANRRRRDIRQRAGAGALALILIGGLTYGGLQILGGDGEGNGIAGPSTPSAVVGFDAVVCGAALDPGTQDEEAVRIVTPSEVYQESTDDWPSSATTEPGSGDSSGNRDADSVTDAWLHNPENGQPFEAVSTGQVQSVVVRDGIITGLGGSGIEPAVTHDLAPGHSQRVSTEATYACDQETIELRTGDQIYHYLNIYQDGEPGIIWGGPWTIGGANTPNSPSDLEAQECFAYGDPAVDNGAIVECPLEILLSEEVTSAPISSDVLHQAPVFVQLGPDVAELRGTYKVLALTEFKDSAGTIINPEIQLPPDTPIQDFDLSGDASIALDIYSGAAKQSESDPIILPEGVVSMTVMVDVTITDGKLANGDPYPINDRPNMRITNAPVSVTITAESGGSSSINAHTAGGSALVLPEDYQPITGVCTYTHPDGTDVHTGACPFVIYRSSDAMELSWPAPVAFIGIDPSGPFKQFNGTGQRDVRVVVSQDGVPIRSDDSAVTGDLALGLRENGGYITPGLDLDALRGGLNPGQYVMNFEYASTIDTVTVDPSSPEGQLDLNGLTVTFRSEDFPFSAR